MTFGPAAGRGGIKGSRVAAGATFHGTGRSGLQVRYSAAGVHTSSEVSAFRALLPRLLFQSSASHPQSPIQGHLQSILLCPQEVVLGGIPLTKGARRAGLSMAHPAAGEGTCGHHQWQ